MAQRNDVTVTAVNRETDWPELIQDCLDPRAFDVADDDDKLLDAIVETTWMRNVPPYPNCSTYPLPIEADIIDAFDLVWVVIDTRLPMPNDVAFIEYAIEPANGS